MDDIKDLNKAKADTWASDQPIKGDKTVDYTEGVIDLTSFTIGVSIEKLSEAIKSVQETAEYTKSMIGHVVPAEPNNIDYSDLYFEYVDEKTVININTLEKVNAGDSAKVYLQDVYPYNSGDLYAYIDDYQIDKNSPLDIYDTKITIKYKEKTTFFNIKIFNNQNVEVFPNPSPEFLRSSWWGFSKCYTSCNASGNDTSLSLIRRSAFESCWNHNYN
jgi:hypothetical protein